jgi:hypothetical protein
MDLVLSTKELKKPIENKRDCLNFFESLAPDVLTKAYPIIPLFAHSKLVTQSLEV